jgi:hypothetical protein
MYKYHTVTGVRKMKWDMLWHVIYKDGNKEETYDRVSKAEAMEVLKTLENEK